MEVRPFDQYVVRIHGSGRLTTRNRKFLRQITPYCSSPSQPPHSVAVSPEQVLDKEPLASLETPVIVESPLQPVIPTVPDEVVSEEPAEQGVLPQTELRRSTRTSKVPDRLQIESFKGQSYEPGPSTASQSVAYNLHPVRPGGGEGI